MNFQSTNNYLHKNLFNNLNQNQLETNAFDYVFIGLGASNCLMLLSFIKNNLLVGKKVAVVDASLKNVNDKTYCFWASKNSEIVKDLNPIISYSYTKVTIDNILPENIENEPYFYIKSIDLYNYLLVKLKKLNIVFYQSTVTEIVSQKYIHKIITEKNQFLANYIFDSRPPKLLNNNTKDIFLLQSFFGFQVRFNKKVFEKDTFDMMNFEVEQNKYTQFIYTLPFSENEALIEFTRFGVDTIEPNYGKKILENYIGKFNTSFTVIAQEVGCIPMTTLKFPKNKSKNILNTGARANLIKPSTGYGFKNMYNFAETTTQHINKNGLKNLSSIDLKKSKRFQFYDHILLIILFRWPFLGKPIFKSLFKKQGAKTVLMFLAEQTTIFKEINIFLFLPLKPFLKALFIYLYQTVYLRLGIVVLLITLYHTLNTFDSKIANLMGYICFITGMLFVGIPHGAVDHLLDNTKPTNLVKFIIKYVLIIFTYYIFWQVFPITALIIFIVYSGFHFGESELKQAKQPITSIKNSLCAFITGLSILLFLMATHLQETLNLLAQIKGINFSSFYLRYLFLLQIPTVIISSSLVLSFALYFNKASLYLLLSLLVLSTTIPLLFAFGLYFIGQHSLNGWEHLQIGLNFSNKTLLKKAFPFSFAAIILFVGFAIFSSIKNPPQFKNLNSQFFIFLACISLPHVLLMHKFYKKNKN